MPDLALGHQLLDVIARPACQLTPKINAHAAQRVRLFLGLVDMQVWQLHPTTGVPALDPAPSIVNSIGCILKKV